MAQQVPVYDFSKDCAQYIGEGLKNCINELNNLQIGGHPENGLIQDVRNTGVNNTDSMPLMPGLSNAEPTYGEVALRHPIELGVSAPVVKSVAGPMSEYDKAVRNESPNLDFRQFFVDSWKVAVLGGIAATAGIGGLLGWFDGFFKPSYQEVPWGAPVGTVGKVSGFVDSDVFRDIYGGNDPYGGDYRVNLLYTSTQDIQNRIDRFRVVVFDTDKTYPYKDEKLSVQKIDELIGGPNSYPPSPSKFTSLIARKTNYIEAENRTYNSQTNTYRVNGTLIEEIFQCIEILDLK